MHLVVPGAIGHFYAMQVVLTSSQPANRVTEYLSARFYLDVNFWRDLYEVMDIHTTYLEEIVNRGPSNLGYCDASGVGEGGVWVDPNIYRVNRVWWFQWPEGVTSDLVSFNNPKGAITNSDLELAALVL